MLGAWWWGGVCSAGNGNGGERNSVADQLVDYYKTERTWQLLLVNSSLLKNA